MPGIQSPHFFKNYFVFDTFDVLYARDLRRIAGYFDTVIYCNMIAIEVILSTPKLTLSAN